jgi:hypothetical protein
MLARAAAIAAQVLAFSSRQFGSAKFLSDLLATIATQGNLRNLFALFVQFKIQGG